MMALDINSIARELRPFAELSDKELEQTALYIEMLIKWNSRINLTSVRSPIEIVTRHFGESYFMGRQLQPGRGETVIDLGSGAGFPGLPLAIISPDANVILVESSNKKVAFLNEVISALSLRNAKVMHGRAEVCSSRGQLVTMRAVENFIKALPTALTLTSQTGRLALMISEHQVEIARAALRDLVWQEPILVPESRSRVLLVAIRHHPSKPDTD